MSLPKKSDAKDHLIASCNKSRCSFRRAARADKTDPLEITPERPRASGPAFVDDFMLEHSLPGPQITWIGIAGSF
jgi:hypothetical protein